jgi:dephospho-CoA kinase
VTLTVGLTGGIGSGKSEVARRFAARGAEVIDADDAAHALSRPGAAGYEAIVQRFGPRARAADGTLDRAWLREHAFADAAFRADLESLLHPLIRADIASRMQAWRAPYGLLVVPLLLEKGGLRDRVQRVLVVDCPEDEQVRRVIARSGLAPEEVRRIMAAQLPRDLRLAQADDVIDNSGAADALEPQIERLDRLYRAVAAQMAP